MHWTNTQQNKRVTTTIMTIVMNFSTIFSGKGLNRANKSENGSRAYKTGSTIHLPQKKNTSQLERKSIYIYSNVQICSTKGMTGC